MDLSSIKDRIRSVPPIAWVIGIGVVILFVVMKGGIGSGSSGGSVSTAGTGGGGGADVPPDVGQEIVNLADVISRDSQQNAAFQKTVTDFINKSKTVPPKVPVVPSLPKPPVLPTKLPLTRAHFGSLVPTATTRKYNPDVVARAMSKFGAGSFGKTIDPNDLKSALDRAKIPHGTNVTNAEIDALLTKAKIAPSSAVVAGYKA